jgi:hypothetical protein
VLWTRQKTTPDIAPNMISPNLWRTISCASSYSLLWWSFHVELECSTIIRNQFSTIATFLAKHSMPWDVMNSVHKSWRYVKKAPQENSNCEHHKFKISPWIWQNLHAPTTKATIIV